jgi:ubiquinone/menaquinone biosynthesis C-methylase UbiE/uncharacterized protein YbaR (Trm112 family)
MKAWLIDMLRCPTCKGNLRLWDEARDATGEIIGGSLRCQCCRVCYAIENGTPRMIAGANPVEKSFAFQWDRQLTGGFERRGRCFALDPKRVVDTLLANLPNGQPSPGSILIDAGCGLGEKAALLAERFANCHVIAFDLTESVCRVRDRYPEQTNLHFVQADINHLPFAVGLADLVVSIGVIHHTADPRQSFDDLAALANRKQGQLAIWVYLDPKDDPARKRYYWRRDVAFLGLGHVLPYRLTYWLCYAYTWAFALPAYGLRRDRAIDPYAGLSLRDKARSMAFVLFDDVTPQYQHRLSRADVIDWYEAGRLSLEDGCDGRGGLFIGAHRGSSVRSSRSMPTIASTIASPVPGAAGQCSPAHV